MIRGDAVSVREVRNRPGDPSNAIVATCAQAQPPNCGGEHVQSGAIEGAVFCQPGRGQFGIASRTVSAVTLPLSLTSRNDSCSYGGRRFAWRGVAENVG